MLQVSSPTIIVERAGSYAWTHKSWRVREEFARTVTSAISLFASTELPLQRVILPPVCLWAFWTWTVFCCYIFLEWVLLFAASIFFSFGFIRFCRCWMTQIMVLGKQLYYALRLVIFFLIILILFQLDLCWQLLWLKVSSLGFCKCKSMAWNKGIVYKCITLFWYIVGLSCQRCYSKASL